LDLYQYFIAPQERTADAAEARGYGYMALPDHSRRVTVAHGLTQRR
jgi:hypothetical protein